MSRKTITISVEMSKRVIELANRWDVSEAEVMRRLFAVGSYVVEEMYTGALLQLRKVGTYEVVQIVFPELEMCE